MVPISVTGVHNCPPNCFITGQGGPRSVCAFPPHLDAGKPSPEFQTCICLLPWFPKSASFICTPEILTQTPLMEIPMAGCAVGRAGRGGSAHDGLRMGGTRVFAKERERKKRRTCGSVRLSSVGCVSTRTVRRPWDFPQETRRPNESSLGPRSGWGKGGGQTATLCYRGFGKKASKVTRDDSSAPLLCHATYQNYGTDKTKGGLARIALRCFLSVRLLSAAACGPCKETADRLGWGHRL